MIGSIRRRFYGTVSADLWDVNRRLEPEREQVPGFGYSSMVPTPEQSASFGPAETTMKEYCKTVVQAAIEHQGWYGGMRMPIPWLRMTLAGLESRSFAPEMMWDGVEGVVMDERRNPGVPSYDAVFEAERALVQKLNLK